jgi:hypothetical protein
LSRSFLGIELTEEAAVSFRPFDLGSSWRPATPELERRTPETTETSNTQASYQTAPELSEPVEHLFDALLEQNEPRSPWRSTTPKPDEPDTSIMATMEIDSKNLKETSKSSELKLSPPKSFTGKREELDDFLLDIELYLEINDEIYNTDKKKIGYALSFMNEGDAKAWKGQYL